MDAGPSDGTGDPLFFPETDLHVPLDQSLSLTVVDTLVEEVGDHFVLIAIDDEERRPLGVHR